MANLEITLALWSLHHELQSGGLDILDVPALVRREWNISTIEHVSRLMTEKPPDFIRELTKRCADAGVRNSLIMIDWQGELGNPDPVLRRNAVENHIKWMDTAKELGCNAIRVNALSEGSWSHQIELLTDGLTNLLERASVTGIDVLIENHGGISSNGKFLVELISIINHPRLGTLPDFGNFRIDENTSYDRYQGVKELLPFARALSAKTYDFDSAGLETTIDYPRIMKIVVESGYNGTIGIEYEGNRLSELEGIRATKALLESLLP